MIHLDTSFLIRALPSGIARRNAQLRDGSTPDETLAMSTVAWVEFLCGPLDRPALEFATGVIDRYIDFTPAHAEIAARLFNQSGRRRGAQMDCMIAAAAIAENAPIATADARDFRRFEGAGLTLA